jgi:His-Xaa-Ser system protein HxsD
MSIRASVDVDLAAYGIESVKRAAYRFSDCFAFDVTISSNTASCVLVFPDAATPEFVDTAVTNFRKELLDQDLRQSIRMETESVRNLILAHAFSRTGLVKSESIQGD